MASQGHVLTRSVRSHRCQEVVGATIAETRSGRVRKFLQGNRQKLGRAVAIVNRTRVQGFWSKARGLCCGTSLECRGEVVAVVKS